MNSEEDELGHLMRREINNLAAAFYQSDGRQLRLDINFWESRHPEERGCWNKSIIAHAFINKDTDLLKYQV